VRARPSLPHQTFYLIDRLDLGQSGLARIHLHESPSDRSSTIFARVGFAPVCLHIRTGSPFGHVLTEGFLSAAADLRLIQLCARSTPTSSNLPLRVGDAAWGSICAREPAPSLRREGRADGLPARVVPPGSPARTATVKTLSAADRARQWPPGRCVTHMPFGLE